MDISETLAPASDQLDAIELIAGPRIFTIAKVSKGNDEQPVNVHFVDFPRPWRPGKSMRRVLAACWGSDASLWEGRRVQLFFDPEVTFGKDKPGGTRISHLSHLEKPRSVPLLVSRGRSANYTVEPLPNDAPTSPAVDESTVAKLAALRAEWKTASDERKKVIEAEVAALQSEGDEYRPSRASRQAEGQVQDVELPDPTTAPDWKGGE